MPPRRRVRALILALLAPLLVAQAPGTAKAAGDQVLVPSADAGVYSGAPDRNWGKSTTARVDSSTTADRPWYLKFPAARVPAGERVTGARLRFYNLALPSGYSAPPAVSVADTSPTWSETTITYATRPSVGTRVTGTAPAGSIGGWTEVPLTGYTGTAVSLLVRATDGGSAHVYAREATAGRPPQLIVTTQRDPVRPDLSPASGAWLGWYLSGNANPMTKESTYGRKTDAFRRYYSLSDRGTWPTASDVSIANADGGRRVLFASVSNRCYGTCPTSVDGKPLPAPGLVVKSGNPDFDGSYYTPAQISSGALDPVIDAQAARIKSSGIRFVLDLMHEVDTTTSYMDDSVGLPEYGGLTLRDWWETTFPAAYRHWHDRLLANGVTNVAFAIDYGGFRSDSTAYTRTYPGDSYVDWIAWDPYDFACTKGGTAATWRPFYNRLEAGLLGPGATSKSYGLFETAVGGTSGKSACRASWISGMAEAAAALPKVKAVLYFNRSSANYNVDTDPAVQKAWIAEIKDPYLNQPHS